VFENDEFLFGFHRESIDYETEREGFYLVSKRKSSEFTDRNEVHRD